MAARISEYSLDGLDGSDVNHFAEALASVFLVRLGPDCSISAFARRSDADLRSSLLQQSLTIALQWQFPPSEEANRYTASERNATGEYVARYALGLADQRTIVERKIDRYTRLFHVGSSQAVSDVRIDGSRQGLRVEVGESPWFESLSNREVTTHVSGQAVFARAIEETRARRVVESLLPELNVDPDEPGWIWGDLFESVTLDASEPSADIDEGIRQLPLDALLAKLEALASRRDLKIEPWLFLARDWVRAHPDRIADLLAAIQQGRVPAEFVRPALLLAIRLSELPEARQALHQVYADPKYDYSTRIQAAISLAGAKKLPEGFVEDVARTCTSVSDRSVAADNFRRQSVAALGAIAREQAERNPAVARMVGDRLSQQLRAAKSPTETRDILTGIGNAGTAELFPEVARLMLSPDTHVRQAAANALRSMPANVASSSYETWFAAEKSPAIRRELVHSYFLQSADASAGPPSNVVRASVAALASESDAHVRRELVQVLGQASAVGDASAKAALAECFRSEMRKPRRDAALLLALGRYVSPSVLERADNQVQ